MEQKEPLGKEKQKQKTTIEEEVASQVIDPINLGEVAIKVITSVLDNFDI